MLRPRLLYSDAGEHMAGGCMFVNGRLDEASTFQDEAVLLALRIGA